MRKLPFILSLFVVLALCGATQAQEFHGAFGFGTVTAPKASTDNQGNAFPSLSGGLYPSFSGIFLFKRHIGFGGEVAWRARQEVYGGVQTGFGLVAQPYRPIFYDFNVVYGPMIGKKVGADIMAGIGGEDLRFYRSYYTCGLTCTNYDSINHFAGHFAGDLRFYFWGHAFIRPEAHYYMVKNNAEFNNVNVSRFTISIGYSFMPGF